MVTVGVDGNGQQADWQHNSNGLFWKSAVTRHSVSLHSSG